MYEDYVRIAAWAMDFCRAFRERPWIFRALARLVFGRHGYREFVGMVNEINRTHAGIHIGYGLASCDYHKEKVYWDWWQYKDKWGYGKHDIMEIEPANES